MDGNTDRMGVLSEFALSVSGWVAVMPLASKTGLLIEILDFNSDELKETLSEAIRNVRRTRGKVCLDDLFKRKDIQSL